ncbi:NAD(P)/FAD-dependent oxidoreductase [Ornithinimicrobium flavum]|uniref:NAD(P)/FAD-dependent oxidoreductase n=1 Tax=Ornithinimicrobium flavum TaxID=1288636 RepID=UPI00106FB919|nr:FAD-dependent oxidoreductase [Ornithinimicrobium flavum]
MSARPSWVGQRRPRKVAVVGAGIVGLATAWHLLERGVGVTVLERSGVAAGASFGNAGWLTPGLAVPLADPAVLGYGVGAILDPASPISVPPQADLGLALFLARFAARCRMPQWRRTMAALVPLNTMALEAYDQLEAGGLEVRTVPGPMVAAFTTEKAVASLFHELDLIRAAGQDVDAERVDGERVREMAPVVSPDVGFGVVIKGQRRIDPGPFMESLADAVRARGGEVRVGAEVARLRHGAGGIFVDVVGGEPVRADQVVLATGAWLPRLAGPHGVRQPLRAGRGYSFSVPGPDSELAVPVYFPHERLVCTPLGGGRIRIGGTMEFRPTDAPLVQARIDGLVSTGRPLLPSLDLSAAAREDEWVGSRPVTLDGLPLVGPARTPGVWVHGGHGMWGMCQGPATARLLVEQMMTGTVPEALRPLDPLR